MEIESECFVRRLLQFTIALLEVDIESEGSVKHRLKCEIVFERFAYTSLLVPLVCVRLVCDW